MAQGRSAPSSNRTLPMSVANMTFMVEKLGEDCAPLQFVRELTQNAIESIKKSPESEGELRWDVAWHHHALTGAYKLAVVDTGIGMTGEEMVEYINKLSSSMHEQSRQGNFGVGAKISAMPKNPEGLVYLSWKDGVGYIIHLWRDPETAEYGLKRWDHPDGRSEYWGYIGDELKPEPIKDNGTMVILLGEKEKQNTMQPPAGTPMPSRWILRYLNTRYFCFPRGITVRAREGWEKGPSDKHSFLREVQGQQPWLNAHAAAKGTVELTTANAHWWILKEGIDDDSGHIAGGGHVAALYQDELYEMVTARAGMARLQGFGVIFGCNRVVLYVQPKKEEEPKVTANIARTNLIYNGEPLPWSEWAAEFREKLPEEIEALQEEISAKSLGGDHRAAIRDRLKRIRDLFHFRRYRPAKDGKHSIDDTATNPGGTPRASDNGSGGGGGGGGRGGRAGDVYSLFLATRGGVTAEEVNSMVEPNVKWVSVADGTRIPPLLEDRAASYLPDQNLLQINADFRVFMDMVDRWAKKFSHVPSARPVVEQVTREWFEQQLIETVMGTLALRRTGQWTLPELQKLWSEEALTAAVLPRYHVDYAINRGLSSKLGSLKEQAV
ncbi:MAG: hypothetical protein DYG94_01995 [Leptolyngbya sp. PLA3]|nr:MAG: hypothetical protein EDM82_02560 [Cyanobacteria bacterium CYA]MCE7967504.1 hypothetical protein [Leptolyngbya sp. PL-A3]